MRLGFAPQRPATRADLAPILDQLPSISSELIDSRSLDPLIDRVGDAQFVLLGEASHGTSEYYRWRSLITQRLVQEKGFRFVGVEGDWPDCYRINRFVKGYPEAGDDVAGVLSAFERWPTWMWANWEVAALASWMRRHNDGLSAEEQVGFYGLDVYSLWESLDAILGYLEQHDDGALRSALAAWRCFEPYGEDVQEYAMSTRLAPDTCEDAVVDLLREIRAHPEAFDGDQEAAFNHEQNALVAVNAERYYRAMVRGGPESWNVRDEHMMATLDRLVDDHGEGTKAIVWEHNTHIGDARYTDMSRAGMFNIGQLAREKHADDGVVLVGFASHRGSVIAGRRWDAPMERMPMPEAWEGSWEDILHRAGGNRLLLFDDERVNDAMLETRGHRAIGVVYHPEAERGNYVPTVLPKRYDALCFIDETEALHPLHLQPDGQRPPELYPWGE